VTSKRRGFVEARLADLRPIRWLSGLWEGVAKTLGAAQDEESATLKAAVSMRVGPHAPDDILHLLAVNFGLPLFYSEEFASLRARISEAFPTWEEAGLPDAIIRSLNAFGVTDVTVKNWADWPTPDNWYSKFWVVLGPGMPWITQRWGFFNWGDSETWGTSATAAEINAVLGQVVFWKSPQSLPVAVINTFGDGLVWGVDAWGSTTWGGQSVVWPLANMWGEEWVKWGSFNWGNGKWIHEGVIRFGNV
jgi:hypothetical protein